VETIILWIVGVLSLLMLVFLFVLLRRTSGGAGGTNEKVIRDEFRIAREESSKAARELREEVAGAQRKTTDSLVKTLGELRESVEGRLREIRESNEKKLDEMRATVDEKLQSTLEKRIGESFKQVSDLLENVYKGLGDMQNLAADVGNLNRVLLNVKTRGTFGEYQLGAILEQILTPEQYEANVATKPDSAERVEFAIKLPGPDEDHSSCVWLPIDAKFPQEDYVRLVDAAEKGDAGGVQQASAALARAATQSAKTIHDKYIDPPHTTDFAIMFMPTEGLYAEILRQAGLTEQLQREYRVVVTGPTTLSALLSSLRMGFRTLAIEKRSSEVWKVLSAVKTEFGKFGNVLHRLGKQLDTAKRTVDQTEVRTRVMERRLREVESLPEEETRELLELPSGEISLVDDEESGDTDQDSGSS
jgi:DNA recombination protein RmuC